MQASARDIVIRPGNQPLAEALREFWTYRDLLYLLAARAISLRYKQTALGITWAVLQPLLTAVIFTLIFGRFAKIPSDGIPYTVFAFSALILWGLLAQGIERASNSIISDEKLITKVYFPRLLIPMAAIGSAGLDFLISLVALLPVLLYFGLKPGWTLLVLPVAMAATMVLAAGIGTLTAALNVRYRDFRYVMPFALQIWLYSSPIAYPASLVPPHLQPYYYLNPMAAYIELMRYAVTGVNAPAWQWVGLGTLVSVSILAIGVTVFHRVERSFADHI